MGGIERFEDLTVWQRARKLTRDIYAISSQGRFARDWGLAGQIQRAAVSVMSNIAEGFERYRRAEFHQFLSVAKGSCAELRSQLYVARDLEYIDDTTFKTLMHDAKEVARLLGALIQAKEKQHSAPSTQHRE